MSGVRLMSEQGGLVTCNCVCLSQLGPIIPSDDTAAMYAFSYLLGNLYVFLIKMCLVFDKTQGIKCVCSLAVRGPVSLGNRERSVL